VSSGARQIGLPSASDAQTLAGTVQARLVTRGRRIARIEILDVGEGVLAAVVDEPGAPGCAVPR
jgi:hypothetical protein